MPNKPPSPCKYPVCPNYATKDGYCDAHRKQVSKSYEATRETAVQRGYTKRWRKIRARKLSRNPMCGCEDCKEQDKVADMVHHKNKNSHDHRSENLMSMNNVCHNQLHMKEGDRF